MTIAQVSAFEVAESTGIRLDPRYHYFRELSRPMIDGLSKVVEFGSLARFANGVNLPRSAYAEDDGDGFATYASVAPIASMVFRPELGIPLRESTSQPGVIASTRLKLKDVVTRDDEVLITRTRATAPGLAWPAASAPLDSVVVPSGFLIRAKVAAAVPPLFISAVLNHPAWRLLTAALASGKSQDNVNQEVLALVPIPALGAPAMNAVASRYDECLAEISALFDGDSKFSSICDNVIRTAVGLEPPALSNGSVQCETVSLSSVSATRGLRIDNRWHGSASGVLRATLGAIDCQRLGSLLKSGPMKGRQPQRVDFAEGEVVSPIAILTGTIQAGTVVRERAQVTTDLSADRFQVRSGDLLVAMDGDGSIGKAAVYVGDDRATVDSHVARCRVQGPIDLPDALSCWLNSSWGRIQTTSLMTGATGQTQLSPADLCDVLVPRELIVRASDVASVFKSALAEFEPVTRRARKALCEASADLTRLLIDEGVAASGLNSSQFVEGPTLMQLLDLLYPSART